MRNTAARFSIDDGDLVIEDALSGKFLYRGRPTGALVRASVRVPGSDDAVLLTGEPQSLVLVRISSIGSVVWSHRLDRYPTVPSLRAVPGFVFVAGHRIDAGDGQPAP
ncbi:MAG: hypothetical protein JNM07_09150 [Phycisphaerae bacterium]|nr:hypothetical protein [Phycisphaerae bacterium]